MLNQHDLAVATIGHLDGLPHSEVRAHHKLNMIRIAERAFRAENPAEGQEQCEPVEGTIAANQIADAAEFCGAAA